MMNCEIVIEDGNKYIKDSMNELSEYEKNILETNFIKGLPKIVKKRIEGETYLLFNISSCISLRQKLEREPLNGELFRGFFKELLQLYENMKLYLLDRTIISLNPEYIFYDEKENKYVYLPLDKKINNVVEKYENILTFFADVCCVEEKLLLEFIFESFGLLNENCFNEIEFIKGIVHHKYEKEVILELDECCEEENFDEEEVEDTSKQKGILILGGALIVLAFWFSFMCQEEFKYSIAGIATSILAVGLIGYVVLKSILGEIQNRDT